MSPNSGISAARALVARSGGDPRFAGEPQERLGRKPRSRAPPGNWHSVRVRI